jgi:hypothetical protein
MKRLWLTPYPRHKPLAPRLRLCPCPNTNLSDTNCRTQTFRAERVYDFRTDMAKRPTPEGAERLTLTRLGYELRTCWVINLL